ncbi:hypothetical protein, partial [Bacillus sp. WP8]|uniref:hypothetical protein n=1 Tax=Bacillus sp. WP8 TaxID=756828 RepID=UPI001C9313C2
GLCSGIRLNSPPDMKGMVWVLMGGRGVLKEMSLMWDEELLLNWEKKEFVIRGCLDERRELKW